VLRAQGNLPAALESFRAALAIREQLAKADPGNTESQRNLCVSRNKIGDVLAAQGDPQGALENFRASLAIAERMAKADPGSAEWQRDLANANVMIGAVHLRQKEEAKAMDAFQRALDIYGEMIRRNPDDEQARLFSAVPLWGIGTLMGNRGGKELEEALAILKPRAETDKLDANKLESIPEIEKQIASLKKGWRK